MAVNDCQFKRGDHVQHKITKAPGTVVSITFDKYSNCWRVELLFHNSYKGGLLSICYNENDVEFGEGSCFGKVET